MLILFRPSFRNGSSDLYWIFLKLVATPAVWFKTILLIVASLLPDYILRIYSTEKVYIFSFNIYDIMLLIFIIFFLCDKLLEWNVIHNIALLILLIGKSHELNA